MDPSYFEFAKIFETFKIAEKPRAEEEEKKDEDERREPLGKKSGEIPLKATGLLLELGEEMEDVRLVMDQLNSLSHM